MHFVYAKRILSAKNGMNLYRGCSYGCIYCGSRSRYYHIEHDFEGIEIKVSCMTMQKSLSTYTASKKKTTLSN